MEPSLRYRFFINPVLWKLDDRAQGEAIRMFATRLGTAMPFWYALCLLLLIAEAVIRRHESGVFWLITAAAIWAVVILVTVLFLVPINNRMMRLNAFSEAALREHKKWDMLQRMRVASLGIAMICFLLASHG